jgi:glucan phosphoethanolaminetransferase (alkaline phosphatase superfamily)
MLGFDRKPIDKAPKIFAARLGFLMSFIMVILVASGSMVSSYVIGGILTLFATLELVIGFCAGCFLYSYVVLPLTNDNKA